MLSLRIPCTECQLCYLQRCATVRFQHGDDISPLEAEGVMLYIFFHLPTIWFFEIFRFLSFVLTFLIQNGFFIPISFFPSFHPIHTTFLSWKHFSKPTRYQSCHPMAGHQCAELSSSHCSHFNCLLLYLWAFCHYSRSWAYIGSKFRSKKICEANLWWDTDSRFSLFRSLLIVVAGMIALLRLPSLCRTPPQHF